MSVMLRYYKPTKDRLQIDVGRQKLPSTVCTENEKRELMDLDIRQKGSICFLKVKGPLYYGPDVTTFEQAVGAAIAGGSSQFVIDLSAMQRVDSCGIGAIVHALRQSNEKGGDVRLVNPSPFAEKTFKMVGILRLFQVFPTEEEALESYTSQA
jgi:anti-sigma B factor antagonist